MKFLHFGSVLVSFLEYASTPLMLWLHAAWKTILHIL